MSNIDSELKKAELLLDALSYNSDDKHDDLLLNLIKDVLKPHIASRVPRALWLKAGMPNLGEQKFASDDDFDSLWLSLIKESSDGGCAEAQYQYGCQLYEKELYPQALDLYKKSAIQGYAPAQWCFGLDTLLGVGVPVNEKDGLEYIFQSAEQRDENAIEFLIENYKSSNYGLNNDPKIIKKWQVILDRLQ